MIKSGYSPAAMNEARTAPIYHGTSFKNAYEIITSNKLIANQSNETETVGVSFTRNKGEAYDDVSLVIDQDKLNQNYKIRPVYRNGVAGRDLAEERVDISINNVCKYITEIRLNNPMSIKILRRRLVGSYGDMRIFQKPASRNYDFNVYYIVELIKLAHKKGIKLDKGMLEVEKWIENFRSGKHDTEKEKELASKAKDRDAKAAGRKAKFKANQEKYKNMTPAEKAEARKHRMDKMKDMDPDLLGFI